MIRFLNRFKYVALVFVAVSVPAFSGLAVMALLFCDSGPVSSCVKWAVSVWAIPAVQIVSLVLAWSFLKKRHRILLSAGLMLLSLSPALLAVAWVVRSRMHR